MCNFINYDPEEPKERKEFDNYYDWSSYDHEKEIQEYYNLKSYDRPC